MRIGNFIYQWYLVLFVFVGGIICSYYLGLSAGRVVGIESALDQGIQPVTRMIISSDVVGVAHSSVNAVSTLSAQSVGHDVNLSQENKKQVDEVNAPSSVPILRPQKLARPAVTYPSDTPDSKQQGGGKKIEDSLQAASVKGLDSPDSPEQAFSRILEDREKKVGFPEEKDKQVERDDSTKKFVGTDRLSLDKSSTQSLTKGWFVQVMATPNRREIEGLAKKLRGSGFPIILEDTLVDGQAHYRLLVGPESSRELSERMAVQLKREPGVSSRIFIRLVD